MTDATTDATTEPEADLVTGIEAADVVVPPAPARPPRRRAPKLDEVLAGAVDQARTALERIASAGQVGQHLGAVTDDDRLVTHRFAASVPGYGGWEWYCTLARAPRSRRVTLCETGLLPGERAIMAPAWVPWSERVSQEEKSRLEAIAAGEDPAAVQAAQENADRPETTAESGPSG